MSPQEKRQRTLVKVCGARSPEVAQAAFRAGADAVGVVVVPGSAREVHPSEALRIAQVAPDRTVLVLRDPDPDRLELARTWPGPVQFHLPFPVPQRQFIQAVSGPMTPAPGKGQTAWLLDAPTAGSGEAWDWPPVDGMPLGMPVILAGGLTPENVAHAIRRSLPWAVDVSSGVERRRGEKDPALIEAFLDAVRACDQADGRTLPPSPADFASLR